MHSIAISGMIHGGADCSILNTVQLLLRHWIYFVKANADSRARSWFSFNDFSKLLRVYIITHIVIRVKGTKLRGLYNNSVEFLYLSCARIVRTHKRSDSLRILLCYRLLLSPVFLESRDYRHADDRQVVCFSIIL